MSSSPTPTPATKPESETATEVSSAGVDPASAAATATMATTTSTTEVATTTPTSTEKKEAEIPTDKPAATEEEKVAALPAAAATEDDKPKEEEQATTSTTTTTAAAKKEPTPTSRSTAEEKVESTATTTTNDKKRPATETTAATASTVEEEKAEAPTAKRRKVTPSPSSSKKTAKNEDDSGEEEEEEDSDEILDICQQIGYKAGDRLEVEWQIQEVDSKEMVTRWWGCTLEEWDGRSQRGVAVRVLDYDPYPEGGFPDRCQEDYVFLSHDLMISPSEDAEFKFRAEGQVQFGNEEEARAAINDILMTTLNKHATKWKQLDRVSQNFIAKGIAEKKELLVEAIMNHNKSPVITATDMQSILQGIMQPKK